MKLWLDDFRIPPDSSWTWAHTASDAINLLGYTTEKPTIASLDFDLGPVDVCGTGLDVARFLVLNFDPKDFPVAIHSQNPVGAQQMRNALLDAGFTVL